MTPEIIPLLVNSGVAVVGAIAFLYFVRQFPIILDKWREWRQEERIAAERTNERLAESNAGLIEIAHTLRETVKDALESKRETDVKYTLLEERVSQQGTELDRVRKLLKAKEAEIIKLRGQIKVLEDARKHDQELINELKAELDDVKLERDALADRLDKLEQRKPDIAPADEEEKAA